MTQENWIVSKIANELDVRPGQVEAAICLLDGGVTVPFIARYRKEATAGLSDRDLRSLEESLYYLRELDERRQVILKSIQKQGKLSSDLEKAIQSAENKAQLEDLYLPYKPKRRTRAQMAREMGLTPLAELLWHHPEYIPEQEALAYVKEDEQHPLGDVKAVLNGIKHILIEIFSESSELIGQLRERLWKEAYLCSDITHEQQKTEHHKFRDYFGYREAIASIAPHRALAILRGRNEGVLNVYLHLEQHEPYERIMARHFHVEHLNRPADDLLLETIRLAWRAKLWMSLELELIGRLKEQSDVASVQIFSENMRDLLLSAPAGTKVVMGLDPGIRTGVKVAVVDTTGKLLETTTVYPHEPRQEWQASIDTLCHLIEVHQIDLIAIGNGTASRETDRLVADTLRHCQKHKPQKIIVSEAGASVYSASELASEELPQLDVGLRGAVSIARRLQDPLAELVKIEPKSIGVGQYQHDVNPHLLSRSLNAAVEDCVNAVGVDVNTASAPLLTKVSGLNRSVAQNIIEYRHQHGPFPNREALKQVPQLGPKTFEQAAGFLRITHGSDPLDASAVHPESYPVVHAIGEKYQRSTTSLVGDSDFLKKIRAEDFVTNQCGLPTVRDILVELEKPGRDPRPDFITVQFDETIHDLKDLKPGMQLEGVVSNVTHFGVFVDIGVHQDGLIHISALSDGFVKNPRDVVKMGQIVQVMVQEVDEKRQRIGLTMLPAGSKHHNNPKMKGQTHMAGTHSENASKKHDGSTTERSKRKHTDHNKKPGSHRDQMPTAMSLAFEKLKALQETKNG